MGAVRQSFMTRFVVVDVVGSIEGEQRIGERGWVLREHCVSGMRGFIIFVGGSLAECV